MQITHTNLFGRNFEVETGTHYLMGRVYEVTSFDETTGAVLARKRVGGMIEAMVLDHLEQNPHEANNVYEASFHQRECEVYEAYAA